MSFRNLLINGCVAGLLAQTSIVYQPAPPTVVQGTADCIDRYALSGYNQNVAWWAIPSDTGAYTMYRVGGGCVFPSLAEPPYPSDGTWGWDYLGRWCRSHVILGWWHGRQYQGGSGYYNTDATTTNYGQNTLKSFFQSWKK